MMEYQICNRCVMDTSDIKITFDSQGICNHCKQAEERMNNLFGSEEDNKKKLEEVFEKIKKECKNDQYDCILGLSGGVDSSYIALLCRDNGLRVLGVHVDAGFNDPVAVSNIKKIVKYCNIDLKTIKIDYSTVADIQKAFLRSGVLNMDVPQDHAFFSALYRYAYENKVRYCINGRNGTTENIGFSIPCNDANDVKNIRGIHKKYGEGSLEKFPFRTFYQTYFKYMLSGKLKFVYPLEIVRFNQNEAKQRLSDEVGFEYYGAKHCESIFTRLYQNYILPEKFGIDKRRAHLSDMIVSGQISRQDALGELSHSGYESKELLEKDIDYVLDFIDMDKTEFENIIADKRISDYREFGTSDKLSKAKDIGKKLLGK